MTVSGKLLIEHCSLTLSSLKTASLFNVKFANEETLYADIDFWNEKFSESGIKLVPLKVANNSALIYMFRQDMLVNDMSDLRAKNILSQYGYENLNVKKAIKKLSKRLYTYEEFPHEIGLFLGYPPEDVEGFICNKGQNCNLCRYWKVYGNENDALQKFEKYDKCKAIYKKLWQEGRDILRLTVKKQAAA